MHLDDRGGKVLDFLKKKQAGTKQNETLDDLPAAPAPNQKFDPSQLEVTSDPELPPVPGDELEVPAAPAMPSKPPEKKSILPDEPIPMPGGGSMAKEDIGDEFDEPMKMEPIRAEPITQEVEEPKPFSKENKPLSPKDIDPRDRFDDLILNNAAQEEVHEEEHEDLKLPSADELASKLKVHLQKKQETPLPNKLPEEAPNLLGNLPQKEESPLAHLVQEEEQRIEKPKAEDFPNINEELPERMPEDETVQEEMPKTPEELPTFDDVPEAKGEGTQKGTQYELPKISIIPKPKEGLVIYISVNDYALLTQEMRKLMRFFSHAGKFLDQGDNPQKVQVLNELYKELDVAQQNLMKIDHKLFEGESYGNESSIRENR